MHTQYHQSLSIDIGGHNYGGNNVSDINIIIKTENMLRATKINKPF